jgi:hypothetical protein
MPYDRNFQEQACTQSILLFLDYYQITNDQGKLLDFTEHVYLWDIYKDFTPRQAILKAAQVGLSTTINIKALWLAKNRGLDIIYSLPSGSDVNDFVSGKTNRLIINNPIFQQWTADMDTIDQKKVGSNVLYFKGTWSERSALATPADLYISDETDRSKQEVVTQFKTRLQHSKFGWEWYFSNPSTPGHGVDKHWSESDQKHWFIKCQSCNEWQYLTMQNIIGNPAFYACIKCKKELDRSYGRWVKKWKDKEVSGYWIPLLIASSKSADYVLNKKKELSEEQFTNFVLGQPYIGKGNVLTRQMFLQNLTEKPNLQTSRPIIGVDTGIQINYVIGNREGLFHYDTCSDYAPLEALLKRWPNAIMVIDQGGDIIGPRKLREKYPNRVFLCFFSPDRKNDELIRWNDKDGTVIADRNKTIQLVVDEFMEKRIPVSGTESDWYDYMIEWLGMYRVSEENNLQMPVFTWNKPSVGRCDYPFATVYWRIGMDRFREESAKFIEPITDSFAQVGIEAKSN